MQYKSAFLRYLFRYRKTGRLYRHHSKVHTTIGDCIRQHRVDFLYLQFIVASIIGVSEDIITNRKKSFLAVSAQRNRKHAVAGLKKVYCKGYLFLKSNFHNGSNPEDEIQLNIFGEYRGKKAKKGSEIIDRLNAHYGR